MFYLAHGLLLSQRCTAGIILLYYDGEGFGSTYRVFAGDLIYNLWTEVWVTIFIMGINFILLFTLYLYGLSLPWSCMIFILCGNYWLFDPDRVIFRYLITSL